MNTQDLSKFGYRELDMAGDLLKLYKSNNDESRLYGNVKIEFNPYSANVFMVDEDYNVAMEYDNKLVDFLSCPNCGHEGFKPDFIGEYSEKCCEEYYNDLYERK